jgi:hypothetical protein
MEGRGPVKGKKAGVYLIDQYKTAFYPTIAADYYQKNSSCIPKCQVQ